MATPALDILVEKLQRLPAERVAEVIDFVDFLTQRSPPPVRDLQDFPVDSVGQWPEGLNLSRSELYGDDGR